MKKGAASTRPEVAALERAALQRSFIPSRGADTAATCHVPRAVQGWEMTLVMFGCMPFLALMGGWMAKSVEMANNATSKAYAEVGAHAVRPVTLWVLDIGTHCCSPI